MRIEAHIKVAATLLLLACVGACGGDKPASSVQAVKPVSGPGAAMPSDALPAEQAGGFDGAKAFAHVEKMVAFGPRPSGSPALRQTQEYIRSQLKSFGCSIDEDNFETSTPAGRLPMTNIVAKIPGASANVVLLMTHYDTKRMENFVGANDAGSSTGLMLEMARLLCGKQGALSVWIVFLDGEESVREEWSEGDNTYGSRQMAAKLALSGDLKRIKAVILADMIGDRNLNLHRESNSTPWLTDLVWSTAKRLGYEKNFLPEPQAIEDDHLPFLRRGLPAVDLIDFDYPPWHTPADTLDKVSAGSIGIVGHVILESVKEIEKRK